MFLGACTPTSSGDHTRPPATENQAAIRDAGPAPGDRNEQADPFPFGRCPEPAPPDRSAVHNEDHSAPFEVEGGTVSISPFEQPNDHSRMCGRVQAIEEEGNGVYRIVLAGSRPEEERTFRVGTPRSIPLPFVVGDPIVVTIRIRQIQIHRVIDAMITDPKGALLMAYSEDGDASFAPGFGVGTGTITHSDPGSGREATRNDRGMVFGHSGRTALVPPRQWRRLDTPGGSFVLTGFAVEWTGGTPPPDASSYRVFTIVRLKAD